MTLRWSLCNPSATAAPCHRSTVRHSQSASTHRPRLFRPRTRLWRRAGTARHISGLRPPNCLGLVGIWPPSRRRGVPALRTPFGRGHNSAWSFRIARKLACGAPCLIGLTTRCFAHRARASCAPRASSRFAAFDCALRVLATSALRASDVRKLTRGFPCLTGVFVPACASLARYSGAAERFALFLNSAWSSHCARKLACGTPCFIGLTSACFRHWRRPSCAPRPSTPSGLRRLRPVSRTARGLRAPLFPSGKRRLLGSAASYGSATIQKAPLDSKGSWRRSRLRGWHRVTLRNQPCLKEKRQGWFCFSFILPPSRTSRYR